MRRAARHLAALALAAACGPLAAGETLKPGSAASLPLAQSAGGARAAALGSAGVGLDDPALALQWNPAALAGLDEPLLAAHGLSGLEGMTQGQYSVALPLGWLGGFAAGLSSTDSGPIEGRDSVGRRTMDYTGNGVGGGLGWGRRMGGGVSAGAALKVNRLSLPGRDYTNAGVDVGALWRPLEPLALGAAWANAGGGAGDMRGASGLRLGGSAAFSSMAGNAMLLAASGEWQASGMARLQAGLEDTILSVLSLRLGWQQELQDTGLEGLAGLTAGVGVAWGGLRLDWAYGAVGDLGSLQRVSLAYGFGPGAGLLPKQRPQAETGLAAAAATAVVERAEGAPSRGKPSQDAAPAQPAPGDAALAMEMAGLRRTLQAQPNSPELWAKLGDLHKQRGETSEALRCWRKSLQMNPNQPELRAKLDAAQ